MEQDPFAPVPRRPWRWLRWGMFAFVALLLGTAAWVAWGVLAPKASGSPESEIIIQPGESSYAIGRKLKAAGIIRSVWAFEAYAAFTGQDGRLQSGAHRLAARLTLPQVVYRLTQPSVRPEVTVTILEGWSNREIAEYLAAEGIAKADEFFPVVQRKAPWWDAYQFLQSRPADRDLEGYLFPDTYRIFPGTTAEALVRKMLDNFDRKLTLDLPNEIARQGKTLHEVLTLASIIEREVPDGPDRPTVAGIFLKRLEIGMALQSDATVNYVTRKKNPRPSADDLLQESLYNTYIHRGLPPGPINNPGISAIRAALNPKDSPYLFYLTTPDGTVIYSRTHDEHVAAKARYFR